MCAFRVAGAGLVVGVVGMAAGHSLLHLVRNGALVNQLRRLSIGLLHLIIKLLQDYLQLGIGYYSSFLLKLFKSAAKALLFAVFIELLDDEFDCFEL